MYSLWIQMSTKISRVFLSCSYNTDLWPLKVRHWLTHCKYQWFVWRYYCRNFDCNQIIFYRLMLCHSGDFQRNIPEVSIKIDSINRWRRPRFLLMWNRKCLNICHIYITKNDQSLEYRAKILEALTFNLASMTYDLWPGSGQTDNRALV